VLLTFSMMLGLLSSVRFQRPGWPRFVTLGLHRNVALVAVGFTVVHVLTTVFDSFVAIPLPDAFVPFRWAGCSCSPRAAFWLSPG
jgi:methionine sulfoxide reductase heme-binding subunit